MSGIDGLLEDLIESQVENLIQEDSYYQLLATPLKSADSIKKEHKRQLIDFFKLTELRKQLETAPDLILNQLPDFTSKEEFDKIKSELDKSGDHFIHYIQNLNENESDKPILFQEIFGLSDETLLKIYELGADFVKNGKFEDANTLFVFLTTMAPHVPSYWIAQGVSLQALLKHEEAIQVFEAAKFLNPDNPAPYFYIIESLLMTKDKEKLDEELSLLRSLVTHLDPIEMKNWEEKLKNIHV